MTKPEKPGRVTIGCRDFFIDGVGNLQIVDECGTVATIEPKDAEEHCTAAIEYLTRYLEYIRDRYWVPKVGEKYRLYPVRGNDEVWMRIVGTCSDYGLDTSHIAGSAFPVVGVDGFCAGKIRFSEEHTERVREGQPKEVKNG